jgi:serine/threonine protein kinase
MEYSTAPMKVGMHFFAILFPIWGVMIPTLTALFIVLLLRLPANFPLLYCLGLISLLVGVVAVSLFLSLLCDDDQIKVTKDGISFPLRFWPALKFQQHHAWQDLGALRLNWQREAKFKEGETLNLFFRGGAHAQLELQHLNPKELEQFFRAFESCATKCERDAELPDFERAIQQKENGSQISFTELWEKSLSNRFSGATFAPLDPETTLQEGDYKILKQLAFGGFAATYLARRANGHFVVLKESCFSQSDESEQKATELFQREAALLGKLSDNHIAKLLDYFLEKGRHYLVTEHMEGVDLKQLVTQKGPLNPQTCIELARQAATALAHIHEQSPPVVHRDINPENFILKSDGTLILSNFGAAKEIVESFTGTIFGKQSFIAPEQFKGKPTTKSDVYGLGATIFFLITGKLPEPLETSDFEVKDEVEAVAVAAGFEGATGVSDKTMRMRLLREIVVAATAQDENQRPDCREILVMLTFPDTAVLVVQTGETPGTSETQTSETSETSETPQPQESLTIQENPGTSETPEVGTK